MIRVEEMGRRMKRRSPAAMRMLEDAAMAPALAESAKLTLNDDRDAARACAIELSQIESGWSAWLPAGRATPTCFGDGRGGVFRRRPRRRPS